MKIWIVLFVLGALCIIEACDKAARSPIFEINKRIVYNEDCDFLLYSTNEEDFFISKILYSPFLNTRTERKLKLPEVTNYYIRDASCDCRFALLIAEKMKENKYDIILYNLDNDSFYNITDGIRPNFSDPLFFNNEAILFLKDGVLHFYDKSDGNWDFFPFDKKFLHLFKGNNDVVFLQDSRSSIWRFDLIQKKFSKIWEAPNLYTSSRKVKLYRDTLFFTSNHENGFNSIYKVSLNNLKEERVLINNHDYSLVNNSLFIGDSLTYIKNERLRFTSNIESLPRDGVIYDYIEKNDNFLLLYSNPGKPASLYLFSESKRDDLLSQFDPSVDYDIVIEEKDTGVNDLVFLPKKEVKHWVLWLHGGPHEQVSIRFNPYIYSLVANNIGVVALNYPGSTGMGSIFELKGIPAQEHLNIQLENIKENLEIIFKKYDISSFSIIGVSYGSILAHKLAMDSKFNVNKLIDFSGINTNKNILESSIEMLYVMGDSDFMLSNRQRVEHINNHKKNGAKTLVLETDGHSISRNKNIYRIIREILDFITKD